MSTDFRNLGTPVVVVPGFPFDTRLNENPLVASVATSQTRVLVNNPNRVFWYIENRGSNPAFLAFNRGVSSTNGKLLDSSGGWCSMTLDEDADVTGWEVFMIANAAAVSIYVMEIERIIDAAR